MKEKTIENQQEQELGFAVLDANGRIPFDNLITITGTPLVDTVILSNVNDIAGHSHVGIMTDSIDDYRYYSMRGELEMEVESVEMEHLPNGRIRLRIRQ